MLLPNWLDMLNCMLLLKVCYCCCCCCYKTDYYTAILLYYGIRYLFEYIHKCLGISIREDTVDRINASLESAGLSVDLVRWRDSNHECMMFNNRYTIHTCSLTVYHSVHMHTDVDIIIYPSPLVTNDVIIVTVLLCVCLFVLMICFSSGNVTFLSQNPEVLLQNMHPVLLKHLRDNNISVGEDLKITSGKHWEILSALTGVSRTREEIMEVGT